MTVILPRWGDLEEAPLGLVRTPHEACWSRSYFSTAAAISRLARFFIQEIYAFEVVSKVRYIGGPISCAYLKITRRNAEIRYRNSNTFGDREVNGGREAGKMVRKSSELLDGIEQIGGKDEPDVEKRKSLDAKSLGGGPSTAGPARLCYPACASRLVFGGWENPRSFRKLGG